MKYKSPLMSQASGSLAGITASHNKGGAYFRQRSTPTNPNTPWQQAVRASINQLSNLWSNGLDAGQRASWDAYALAVVIMDTLGEPIYPTGINHYIRSNVPRLQAGLPRVDTAPSIYNTGEFTAPSFEASEATQQLSVTFENTDDWANEDDSAMIIGSARPQGLAINFFKGPYRYAGTVDGNGTTPPTSPALVSVSFPFVQNQKLFVHVRVSRADGRLSTPFRGYALALA